MRWLGVKSCVSCRVESRYCVSGAITRFNRDSQSYGIRIYRTEIHHVVRIKPFVWLVVFLMVLGRGWIRGSNPTGFVMKCLLVKLTEWKRRCSDQCICKVDCFFMVLGHGWAVGMGFLVMAPETRYAHP